MIKHKLFFIALHVCMFIPLLNGCESSSSGNFLFESNEEAILKSFQETMDEDPEFSEYGIIAKEVSLVKKVGNEYAGLVDIEYKGKPRKISITATIDGSNVIWETKPGQFVFTAVEELEELGKEFEKLGEELEEEMETIEEDLEEDFVELQNEIDQMFNLENADTGVDSDVNQSLDSLGTGESQ